MSDLRKYIQSGEHLLQSSISASATSLTLQAFKTSDGTNITTTDIGTLGHATLDPNTSSEESISFTTITQNGNGTATISGITRGLKFVDPYTETTALKLAHGAASVFIMTNTSAYYSEFANKSNNETISQTWIFSALPNTTAGDPVADNDLARKGYVDGVVAGTFPSNRLVVAGTAGETIADGNLIFFDSVTDNEWKLCDADTANTVENVLLGIAQGAGTNGNAITGGVLLEGLDDAQTGLTGGNIMFASNVAGGISSSAGTNEVTVGIVPAGSTTTLYFSPRFNQQLTENQQDALVGNNTDVAVGAGNLFVTQTGLQHNAEKYAVDNSSSTTAYTIALSPIPTSLTAGMIVFAKIISANTTTTPTLNVNSLGAKTIVNSNGSAVVVGQIGANSFNTFMYDGTNLVIQNLATVLPAIDGSNLTGISSGKIAIDLTDVTITNSTSETTLFTTSIPANTFGTNNGIKARLHLQSVTANSTYTLRLKYGATTMVTIASINHTGDVVVDIVILADGATNVQEGQLTAFGVGAIATISDLGTAAEDSTGALNLVVTAQYASNDSTLTFKNVYVEVIK